MSLPPSKLSCERSAKLDQRLARLADIDSDCELTDREENCDLLEQKFGTHSHSNYLIRMCKSIILIHHEGWVDHWCLFLLITAAGLFGVIFAYFKEFEGNFASWEVIF